MVITDNFNTVEPLYVHDTDPSYVTSDIVTSFMILIGVFFPSVTGMCVHTLRAHRYALRHHGRLESIG
jgi:hypothetical protein